MMQSETIYTIISAQRRFLGEKTGNLAQVFSLVA